MTTVRIVDGMKYGFKLLGIYIAMVLVGGAFVAGGAVLIALGFEPGLTLTSNYSTELTQITAGALLSVVGVLGLYGATVGLLYKFIADSVIAGLETADLEDASRAGNSSPAAEDDDTGTAEESADVFEMAGSDEESASTVDDGASQSDVGDTGGRSPAGATTPPDQGTTASAQADTTAPETSPPVEPSPPSTAPTEATGPSAADETGTVDESDGIGDNQASEADSRGNVDAGASEMPERDPVDPRPTSPNRRSWQADDEATAPEDTDDSSGHGTAGPETAGDDWEESDDSEELWEMSDSGETVRENIDQVVSEATDPETGDGTETIEPGEETSPAGTITDTTSDADAGPVNEAEPGDETIAEGGDDERKTMDDAPGEFVAKPPVDGDEDETDDDTEEVPDEPLTDAEIEDTTDEEGDWEPLDESDL